MAGARTVAIVLTAEERSALERNVRRRTGAHGIAQRSRMILLAADGLSNEAVAARVGVWAVTVGIWRRRFAARRLAGLEDERRPGRPRTIDEERVEAVIAATKERGPDGAPWSTRTMAKRMGMSQSAISRIWRATGTAPQRAGGGEGERRRRP
jgi:transposase